MEVVRHFRKTPPPYILYCTLCTTHNSLRSMLATKILVRNLLSPKNDVPSLQAPTAQTRPHTRKLTTPQPAQRPARVCGSLDIPVWLLGCILRHREGAETLISVACGVVMKRRMWVQHAAEFFFLYPLLSSPMYLYKNSKSELLLATNGNRPLVAFF